jgi:uncharacterized protein (DUF2267 family)
MEYQEFVSRARNLPFIQETDKAEAAVKATVGMLASRLDDARASLLANRLPEPLTFEKLRGDQINPTSIDVEQGLNTLDTQFNLNHVQSNQLLESILSCVAESLDEDTLEKLKTGLSDDWRRMLTIH